MNSCATMRNIEIKKCFRLARKNTCLHDLTNRMPHQHVTLLNTGGISIRNGKQEIADRSHLTAGFAGEAHGLHPVAVGLFNGADDVGGVARGREGNQYVVFLANGGDPAVM